MPGPGLLPRADRWLVGWLGPPPTESFATGSAPKVTIVFFLGGCTFTEIAALRFLSDQGDSTLVETRAWVVRSWTLTLPTLGNRCLPRHALPAGQRDYIVATTKLINGNTLLESIIESVENKTM